MKRQKSFYDKTPVRGPLVPPWRNPHEEPSRGEKRYVPRRVRDCARCGVRHYTDRPCPGQEETA